MTEFLIRIVEVRDEKNRDTVIEQVEKMLDERDMLQQSNLEPFSDEEQAFGQSILSFEQELQAQLEILMNDIRMNISEQQKKKVSAHAYMDPYNKVYRDGIFFDNKN